MSFKPDSSLVDRIVASPNHSARRDGPRADMILLHYTGMKSGQAALERLCEREAKVSSHYLVFEDGEIVQMVPEALRAQHAGVSLWHGDDDINSRSIGIEIENPGHDLGYPDFSKRQIDAVIALCRDILKRVKIPPDFVLAHSDVAPTRKQDPGEKFPWKKLHESGIGLWVTPAPITADGGSFRSLTGDNKGSAVSDLQKQLAEYGYGLPATGVYDALTKAVVSAFQLHFRPERIDGVADASTLATLHALLTARAMLPKA